MTRLLFPLLLAPAIFASDVSFWKINKVKSNDSLNVRSQADYKSDKVTSIPFNAQCVKNHGCGQDISLDVMMHMQEDEVKAFLAQAKEDWCYVEYKNAFGWVNKYYLQDNSSACQ